MRGGMVVTLSCVVLLVGCGEHFPVGERLWPGSYGPPYGQDLYRPNHAEHVASGERHAQFLSEEGRSYSSHEACNAAMERLLAAPGGEHHGPVAISPLETMGHHVADGVTHEYRCSGYKMSQRAWRSGEAHGEGYAPAH